MPSNPYTVEFSVRFRDIDAMGHVNNAVYATYLETARAYFFQDVLDESLTSVGTVIASLELEFHEPIEFGEHVTVALEVKEIGMSSLTMQYEIRATDERKATAETVQVAWDRSAGESRPIPDDWRESIAEFEDQ